MIVSVIVYVPPSLSNKIDNLTHYVSYSSFFNLNLIKLLIKYLSYKAPSMSLATLISIQSSLNVDNLHNIVSRRSNSRNISSKVKSKG